jgi:predicted ferric reductase
VGYKLRNKILIGLIVISLIPGIFLLRFSDLDGTIRSVIFLARVGAVAGIIMLMWETFMGARSLVRLITPDTVFVTSMHKFLGKWATLLIIVHPVLYVIYYWVDYQINILEFDPTRKFSVAIWVGVAATAVLILIWITSVTLKKRLGFRKWHLIHILTYVIVPLVLVHTTLISTSRLGMTYWAVMSVLYFLLLGYQILFHLEVFRLKYEIVSLTVVGDNTFEIKMKPKSAKVITPQPGQFVYVKHALVPETHPFSVSAYDSATHELTIAIKDLGPFSHLMETAQIGDPVSLDGAYGVFMQEAIATSSPLVLLAGGIGCSPMMPFIQKLEDGWNKEVTMFMGNRERKDIPYFDRLTKLASEKPNFKIVHILENTEDDAFEKGYITGDVLKKYLKDNLLAYEYFVCGPPPMMAAMDKLLKTVAHPSRIHFERFM